MPQIIKASRVSFEGLQSSMKTSTALTAPIPLVHFAFDMGYEGAIYGKKAEYWKGLDIKVYDYDKTVTKPDKDLWRGHDITIFLLPRPPQTSDVEVLGMRELWSYFTARIGLAVSDSEYLKSGIVDTMTLARRVRADAHLQMVQANAKSQGRQARERLQEIEYGPVNDSVRDIYTNYESVGVNLVATHHLQDEREDVPVTDNQGRVTIQNRRTGRYLLEGYSKTYQAVDFAMRMEMTKTDSQAHSKATFVKCRYNPDLQDTSLVDVTWNSLMSWVEMSLGGTVQFPKSEIAE